MKEIAYHYTTIEALFEILKKVEWNKQSEERYLTFWASSIYAMNDPQEFMLGYKILQESLLPKIENKLKIKEDHLKLSNLAKKLGYNDNNKWNKELIEQIYTKHEIPFIVSFSNNKDFLPMWKEYANDGKGVCLCFNNQEYIIDDLKNIDVDFRFNLHAQNVSYSNDDESVEKVLYSMYRKSYDEYRNDKNTKQKQKMLSAFVTMAVTTTPYFKHRAYQYENEVRLIKFKKDHDDVKYRISKKGRLIPYIEIPVKLNYLEQIIIGPCAEFHSYSRELRSMFEQYRGNEKDFIIPSNIPYRIY